MKNNCLNKGVLRGLLILLLFFYFDANAQSLTGTRGLIKAPTARMYESGTLAIGMGYVPAKFFTRTSGPNYGVRSGNAGLNTFINVTALPFLEIMFRYSHEFNIQVSPQTRYFPDRMFTARFKILNESKYKPSLVLGLQDLGGALKLTSSSANFYTSTYLVSSKLINLNNFTFDVSIGYGFNYNEVKAKEFKGLFGGIEIYYNGFKNTQLLLDFDTTSLNLGVQKYLFNRIHTVIGLMDFEPMFLFAYRYKI